MKRKSVNLRMDGKTEFSYTSCSLGKEHEAGDIQMVVQVGRIGTIRPTDP